MRSAALALLLALVAAPADARTVVIDEHTPGTAWDAFVDGFPMLAPKDGEPDVPGNPLAIALQAHVTEERAAMEFPLASLTGIPSSDILGATLSFNVDDVIETFGPNTTFDGTAARTILVHFYDGDGEAKLPDFKRTGEDPVSVATGPPVITDATLRTTGAVFFHVDALARLLAARTAGTPFLGALWRTNDVGTATSLDDGRTGQMPGEGGDTSAGSKLPYLTIEIRDPLPPPPCATAGEPCDDGNPCTVDDICSDGACQGSPACGDGTVQADCGEQCDDGNAVAGDGCNTCQPDTVLGGTDAKECLVAVASVPPPAGDTVTCTDGDACDADPTPDRCGIAMTACLGRADARLSSCSAAPAAAASVVKPGRSPRERSNRGLLESALAGTTVPGCSRPVTLAVDVRRRGRRRLPGKAAVVIKAKVPGAGKDRDTVRLVCRPAG